MSGQGEIAKLINETDSGSLDTCLTNCRQTEGCIAVDYSNEMAPNSSCRMFKTNTPMPDTENDRKYCMTDGKII